MDRDSIQILVERFLDLNKKSKTDEFSEADVGSKFVLPLFKALGWDIDNIDEVAEQRRTLMGPADYSLRINRVPRIIVEIKKFSEDLDGKRLIRGKEETYAYQVTQYAWHQKVDWCVLTNFKELRLYYAHTRKPEEGLQFKLDCYDFLGKDFERLSLISRESIVSGRLDNLERRRTRIDVDRAVLETLFDSRTKLTDSILKNHPKMPLPDIKEAVQKILDRIIFTRVAEDRSIIGPDSLWIQLETWKKRDLPTRFVKSLKNLFRELDDVYDSKLFEPHFSEDLLIDDEVFEHILSAKGVYAYNFDLISSDVLGAIYEDYIGYVLAENERGIGIVASKTTRHESGIYYTPKYIVDYIVQAVIEETLEKTQTVEQVSNVKVLDPACGSGSFLIAAFDALKRWYDEHNKQMAQAEWNKISQVHNIPVKILSDNLFGLDLDCQAAEIASLNLMLKALQRRQKLPQILGVNIRTGNALLSPGELSSIGIEDSEKLSPFDWRSFDFVGKPQTRIIIIGNPPYVGIETIPDGDKLLYREVYSTFEYRSDVFSLFMERSINILEDGDMCGFIVPSRLLNNDSYCKLRSLILNKATIEQIVQLGTDVFRGVKNETMILILKKNDDKTSRDKHLVKIVTNVKDLQAKKYNSYSLPQHLFATADKNMFNIKLRPEIAEIFQKIKTCSIPLGEIARANQGMRTGDNENLLVKEKKDERYKPIVRGKDVERYFINFPNLYVDYDPPKLDAPRNENIFKTDEKLIVQEIRNINLERRVVAAYDNRQYYALQTTNVINLVPNSPYSIKYLLAIINSEVINVYFKTMWIDIHIKSEYLEQIPIPKIEFSKHESKAKHDKLVQLVTEAVRLKDEVNRIVDVFERYWEPIVDEVPLRYYYDGLSISDREIIDIRSKGKIRAVEVQETSDGLLVLADFTTTEKGERKVIKKAPILNLGIKEKLFRKFIQYVITNNRKKLGEGNVASKILSLTVPRFSKNPTENSKIADTVICNFLDALLKKSEMENELNKIDSRIDQEVYSLYGLTQTDVDMLKSIQSK